MKDFKGYTKGINLGGWLSQCDYSKDRLDNFIQEADFAKIASWGADHVRLPFDYNIIQTEDGILIEDGFARIQKAVDYCEEYGLNLVLDLHKTKGFSFDEGEKQVGFFESQPLQNRFYALWEEMAKRFGRYSDRVAFELLNEVTDKEFMDEWNRISTECIKKIRVFAPDTVILIGGYWNNSPEAVEDLLPPYDDKIVYNMHCYDPLKFTHQGATWTDMIIPEERFSFDEMNIKTEDFLQTFAAAREAAQKNNTVLYCGEYGVIDRVTPEDTVKWFKTIHAAFIEMGISRCAWSYKEMDFGLSDERLSDVIDTLIQYL